MGERVYSGIDQTRARCFSRFGKKSRGKNSNSRNFSQKLLRNRKVQAKTSIKKPSIFFGKLTFSSKNSLFPRKTRIFSSPKNSRIFEKLKHIFSKKLKKSESPLVGIRLRKND